MPHRSRASAGGEAIKIAATPKPIRHKLKVVRMLERLGRKHDYTMLPPIWINGVPHVAFKKEKEEE